MKQKQSWLFGVLFSALLLAGISTSFPIDFYGRHQCPETQRVALIGPGDEGPKVNLA